MRISDWSSDVCPSDLQFSQEIQISGNLGNLDWVPGVNYFREAGDESSRSAIFYNRPIATYTRAFGDFISKSVVIFGQLRSEEHTSELQSLMRISYVFFCLHNKH